MPGPPFLLEVLLTVGRPGSVNEESPNSKLLTCDLACNSFADVSGITGHVSREVIDYVDHDDRIVSYHVYGGEFEESYNSYKVTTQISPSSYNASTLKYWVECEPIDGYSLFPMSSKTAFTAS